MYDSHCNHQFEVMENGLYCVLCGMEEQNGMPYMELDHQPTKILSTYIHDTTKIQREKIRESFEYLIRIKNIRNTRRRGILAACYFFIMMYDYNQVYCLHDILAKFCISKSKFSKAVEVFLTHNRQYRTKYKLISDYVDLAHTKTGFPLEHKTSIYENCRNLDQNSKLSNFNPFSCCLVIIFKYLRENGYKLKRSRFFEKANISDQTVLEILKSLKGL